MLKRLCKISALAAALCLAVQPVTAQQLTGVTDTEIHIGEWGPQTGPAAPWGAVARGTAMLFQMVNDAGGIHGRKIVFHSFDDQYNPAKTVAGVKELVEKEPGVFGFAS
ncbi:MAG: ABC transporter substrate-binding protein, partial [Rubrivivax sp.]|nr:ABC transporter substrate-binding protein [Rubrivivax sp.]